MAVTVTIPLYQKQIDFRRLQTRYRAFIGGIGSGKSYIGAHDLICRAKPKRLYLVAAPTYVMLSDASMRSFIHAGQCLEGMIVNINRGAPPSIRLRNGAEVIFRSTEHPDRLRGPNLSGIWMDEAGLMKRDAYDVLIGRLREGGEHGWLSATMTPKGKAHWTYKVFASGAPDTGYVRARSGENPFLPPTIIEDLKKRYTARQIQQELEGEFLDDGGNHFYPYGWPRYEDRGDAYRVGSGPGTWKIIRKADCTRVITLDWAANKRKRKAMSVAAAELTGDYNAFVVGDLTNDGDIFIIDVINERLGMEEKAPRLEGLCQRYEARMVVSDDDLLSEGMLLDCRRYRIPEIKVLPLGNKDKLVRAQQAIIRGENGRIYLPQDAVWLEGFSDQLAIFTGTDEDEHDDMVDAVGIFGRLADDLTMEYRCDPPEIFSAAPDRFWMGR